jgi:hypothetical protein
VAWFAYEHVARRARLTHQRRIVAGAPSKARPLDPEELQHRRGTRIAEHLKLVLCIIDQQGR